MSYDVKQVKAAAEGRWSEIVNRLAGVDARFLRPRHGPCPRCGGTDRWRVFGDFEKTGGGVCNQCGKFADGIDLMKWLLGINFSEALAKVGEFLGMQPQATRSSARGRGGQRPQQTPDEQLEFIEWSDQLAAHWCQKKKPATPEGLKRLGARMARYQGRHTVIALPVVGQGQRQGWIVYNASGGTLPHKEDGIVEHLKVKNVSGTNKGFVITCGQVMD